MGLRIKIDKADTYFSLYVRELADNTCEFCGNNGESIQASHYFGRRNEAVRFSPSNVSAFCFFCHQKLGSDDREAYRDFMIKKLSDKGFKSLIAQANSYKKKDRKLEAIRWREAYRALCKDKGVTPRR